MKHYVSGSIKEINAGFKVSLLNGQFTKIFHSDEKAVEFTVAEMKKFVNVKHTSAAVKFKRADGINTYLLFSEERMPFEMTEFDFVKSHSALFHNSELRTIMDTHTVDFNSIARVTSSGTPITSMLNWVRLIAGTIFYTIICSVIMYYLANPSTNILGKAFALNKTIDNHDIEVVFGILMIVGLASISFIAIRKIYYRILVGKRKHRTSEQRLAISQKNWAKFRTLTRIIDRASLAITIFQLILLLTCVIMMKDTVYLAGNWETYLTIAFTTIMSLYLCLMIFLSIKEMKKVNNLEKTLVKVYIPEKYQDQYNFFLKRTMEDIKRFESKIDYFFLKTTPKLVLDKVKNAEQIVGSEARELKKIRKQIFLEKINGYEIKEL